MNEYVYSGQATWRAAGPCPRSTAGLRLRSAAQACIGYSVQRPLWKQPRGKSMALSQLRYNCHLEEVASVGD